jgi:hypothetical protein
MRRVTKELLDAPNQTPMNKSLLRTSIACAAFLILFVLQASPAGAQVSVGPQDTTGTVGDTVSVAVEAGDLSQSNVASYQFTATYDSTVIEVIGVETENTLTSGDPEVNTDNAGEARVAFASDEVLGGPGTLIELRTVLSSAGSTTISLEEARFFNRDGQEVTEDINVTGGVVESSVAVTAPDLRVSRTTDSLEIPIQVGDLTGAEVTSYQFTLAYDPDVIDITDAITEGTMSEEEELQFNKTAPDTVKVSFASSGDPLEGPGTLLRFQASTEGAGTSPLNVEDFFLQGSSVPTVITDGSVTVNRPPMFTSVPEDLEVRPTETAEAQIEAEDPDGDPITFSLTEAPDRASIDSASGDFAFTPTVSQAGTTFEIGVQASDGNATADTSFAVIVEALNRGPIAVDIDQSFGDATDETNYRLLGLPGQVDLGIETTLSGDPGEFNDWRVFWDDGSSTEEEGLVEFDGSSQFNFQPGRGFWALSKNNWSVSETFQPVPLDDETGNASIPLHDGWNIISNPLGKDISWSSVQAVNDVSQPLWSFTGSFDQSSSFSSAQSGQAYYFLNDGGLDELLIPFFESSGSEAAVASKKKEGEILRLDALVDGDKASSVWVGTQPGAKEGRDEFDGFSPPGYFTEATLSAGNENIESKHSLAVDVRPSEAEGHTYDLVFETESEGRMTLQASGLSDLATEKQVRLYNKQNGRSLDLRSTPTADVEVSSGEAEFALLIGTSSYVEEAKSDLVPDELSLRQYPNPFQAQGQTTIEYSLPEQTEVSVKVYDVLGRRVRTLVSEETQRSGVHTLQWNARDKQGQAVASGVYFARLDAGQTRSIKMVVVK